MKKKNYKMKTYFGLGFGIILIFLAIIMGAGYFGINSLSNQVIYMLETDAIVAEHSARARANVLGLRRYEKDVFLNITNKKKVKSYAKKWIGQYKSTVARIQGMEKGVTLEKDKQTLKLMRESLEQYKSGWEEVLSRIESGEIKTPQEGNAAIKKYKTPVRQLIVTAKDTATKGNKRLKSIKGTVENITSNLSLFLIIAALVTFIFSILIAFYCIKAITRQIGLEPSDLQEISDKIAQGDLTLSLTDNGNATGIFATILLMKKKLNQAITNVENSAQSIKSGSEQVSGSSQQLSQGTAEQASSVEEITSSITELTSQSKQAAANAEDVRNISKEALDNAQEGIDKMNDMVSSMNDISESSDKISKIMKTIEEIAFQTNLLALNAAVEAARAGRHGKGFAVVAEEVNSLSKRSSVAAKETAEIIENIMKKIDGGKALTNQSQESFQKILNGIQNVNKLVEEITMASKEQVKGIEQVEDGIQQIDKVTQSNASIAEENAAASEDLSGQAGKLAKIVSRFQLHNEDQRVITEASQGGNGHKILETEKGGQKVLAAPKGTIIDPEEVISLGEENQDYRKF